jgi:hypothetical protein
VVCNAVVQAQRETVFHRFDRSRDAGSDDLLLDDNSDSSSFWDDNATIRSTDDGVASSPSSALQRPASTKFPLTPTGKTGAGASGGGRPLLASPLSSKVSNNNNTAKSLLSVFSFSNITSALAPKDDFDRKVVHSTFIALSVLLLLLL